MSGVPFDRDRIQRRASGAKHLSDVISLAELSDKSPDFLFGFARAMREFADGVSEVSPVQETSKAMTDAESRAFEQRACPYRKHQGTPYSDVPIDYLDFVAEGTVPLQRYLGSERAKIRREVEESDDYDECETE